MGFRQDLLAQLEEIRADVYAGSMGSPGDCVDGIVNQLTIRTRVWPNPEIGPGYGTAVDTDLVLPPRYPVRQVTTEEITSSAGRFESGDLIVEFITPFDGISVGYTPAQLAPNAPKGTQIIYLITGTHPGEYVLRQLQSDGPYAYNLVIGRARQADARPNT